ncbi:MAG: hypothetical protein IJD81_04890 [Oscillospiraceae bacterium]|nr:hypothetical protein [Oscillospiraceae bacterium]
MATNASASLSEQPVQARSWELTPITAKTTRTFGTPTGHKVIVIIVEDIDNSHVSVHVTNETAYVNMGFASFVGDNHQQECKDYLTQHLSSPALEHVCRHFDALCNPFADEDIA